MLGVATSGNLKISSSGVWSSGVEPSTPRCTSTMPPRFLAGTCGPRLLARRWLRYRRDSQALVTDTDRVLLAENRHVSHTHRDRRSSIGSVRCTTSLSSVSTSSFTRSQRDCVISDRGLANLLVAQRAALRLAPGRHRGADAATGDRVGDQLDLVLQHRRVAEGNRRVLAVRLGSVWPPRVARPSAACRRCSSSPSARRR